MIKTQLASLALIVGLAGCSGHIGTTQETPHGTAERVIHNNGGVATVQYRAWRERAERLGTSHYIIDGPCVSWCAFMAFFQPKSCFTESANLGFHPAAIGVVQTEATRKLTQDLLQITDPAIREWWMAANPTVLGMDLVYDDLMRIAPHRECGPDGVAVGTTDDGRPPLPRSPSEDAKIAAKGN